MFLVIETPETTADPVTPLERYMLASPPLRVNRWKGMIS
jgi:hypothetical protein